MSRAVDSLLNLHEIEEKEIEERVMEVVLQAMLDHLAGIETTLQQILAVLQEQGKK